MTELCDLAYKYGSDKCPRIKHHYTPWYFEKFSPIRNKVKKLFEIGVGYKEDMKHVPDHYVTGASLYVWRDFFPYSQIYSIDIEPTCIFKTDRIETFLRSQSRETELMKVLKITGRDFDIVVDDGSHLTSDQIFTCKTLMKQVKKDVIYIIEDALESRVIKRALEDEYDVEIVNFEDRRTLDDRLVVVKNK